MDAYAYLLLLSRDQATTVPICGQTSSAQTQKNLRLSLPEFGTSYGCSFDYRCVVNLAKTFFGVPPPPPAARDIDPHRKPQYLLHARPEVVLEKSKRLGKVALAHYNRRKKVKFDLLDVMPVVQMPESGRLYTHINFTARSSKEGSKEQVFFAEIYNCSKRRDPSGYLLTCCEPLRSDATGHGGRRSEIATNASQTI